MTTRRTLPRRVATVWATELFAPADVANIAQRFFGACSDNDLRDFAEWLNTLAADYRAAMKREKHPSDSDVVEHYNRLAKAAQQLLDALDRTESRKTAPPPHLTRALPGAILDAKYVLLRAYHARHVSTQPNTSSARQQLLDEWIVAREFLTTLVEGVNYLPEPEIKKGRPSIGKATDGALRALMHYYRERTGRNPVPSWRQDSNTWAGKPFDFALTILHALGTSTSASTIGNRMQQIWREDRAAAKRAVPKKG